MRKVWFYYCFTALALWFITAYPVLFFLISTRKGHRSAYLLRSWLSRAFLKLNGIRLKVSDRREYKADQPVILCSNHASELDIIVLLSIFRGPYAFMGKQPLARLPLFGKFFRALDIAVDRKSIFKAYGSYQAALERLKAGYSVVIFPEGGIHGDPATLQRFKNGAFRLAASSQVQLLPVAIQNSWRILHPFKHYGSPGLIKVVIHPAISPANQEPETLKAQVRACIEEGVNI